MEIKRDSLISGRPKFSDVPQKKEVIVIKNDFMSGNPLLRKLAPLLLDGKSFQP